MAKDSANFTREGSISPRQRLSVTIPSELHTALQQLAAAEDRSLSWLISRAIHDFIAIKAAEHPGLLLRQTALPFVSEDA